jgi:hypothetical protein
MIQIKRAVPTFSEHVGTRVGTTFSLFIPSRTFSTYCTYCTYTINTYMREKNRPIFLSL